MPSGGQIYLLDSAVGTPAELYEGELLRSLPVSVSVLGIYSIDHAHETARNAILKTILDDE